MSYSRWICSYWYTFFNTDNEFEICDVCTFKPWQLRKSMDVCIDFAMKLSGAIDRDDSEELEDELRDYMEQFLEDYESDKFETHSFD